jgi:D-galactarolactone cycloisomerase
VLDAPVHALLSAGGAAGGGGAGRTVSPVYDGSIYFDDLDPEDAPRGVDVVLANVRDGWDDGHRSFKLKIGRGHRWMASAAGVERDVEVIRAVHDEFPSATLLVDGNDGFTSESLDRLLDGVAGVPIFWIEEPFTEERGALERLHARLDDDELPTLVADGEYHPDVPEVLELAQDGLVDVLLMDVQGFGFTPWRELLTDLAGTGQLVSPHAWGMPLKTLYVSHLAAAYEGVVTIEGVRGTVDGVDLSGYTLADGHLAVSSGPGFGLPLPAAGR